VRQNSWDKLEEISERRKKEAVAKWSSSLCR